jgi:hypothetical protein
MACQHIQRMQKALTQINFQVQHVINDMTGITSKTIGPALKTKFFLISAPWALLNRFLFEVCRAIQPLGRSARV